MYGNRIPAHLLCDTINECVRGTLKFRVHELLVLKMCTLVNTFIHILPFAKVILFKLVVNRT